MKLFLQLYIILSFSCQLLSGAPLWVERIGAQDGLFSNRIFKSCRDHQGYLWVVGINGVARYDGHYVSNFSQENTGEKYYINAERFYAVQQDRNETVWIGGESGLHYLDPSTQTFVQIGEGVIEGVKCIEILDDSLLRVSCSTSSNYLVDYKTKEFKPLDLRCHVAASITDNTGSLWQLYRNGHVVFQEDTILSVPHLCHDICFTPNGDLYLATDSGLLVVLHDDISQANEHCNYLTVESNELSLTDNYINAVEYINGVLWVGSRTGLNLLQLDDDGQVTEVVHHYNDPNDIFSLSNNQINDIYVDNEGIIWLSTYGGLNKIDPQHLWFNNYRYHPDNDSTLHDNNIFPTDGNSQGQVWFGSYRNGYSKLDVASSSFRTYNSNDGKSFRFVHDIFVDEQDNAWISADDNLMLDDGSSVKRIAVVDHYHKGYQFEHITAIVRHSSGIFWMGIDDKLVKLRRTSSYVLQVEKVYEQRMQVVCFHADDFGRLWIGTGSSGLGMLQCQTDELFFYSDKNQPVFRSNTFQTIEQDTEGNLWIGSTCGLYCAKDDTIFQEAPRSLNFQAFFVEDGLTHNYVSGILPSPDGGLWLSSWKGIVKYNPSSIDLCRFIPYTFSDGLVDEKYNRKSNYYDKHSNTYYWGSVNGVNYLTPKPIVKTKILPHVLLHSMHIDGKDVGLLQQSSLDLSTWGRVKLLDLTFSSSSLLSPSKQVFAWKLEGLHDNFTFTRDRNIQLTDIPSGKYKIIICAVSVDGKLGLPVNIPLIVYSWWWLFLLFVICICSFILWFEFSKFKKIPESEVEVAPAPKYEFSKLTVDKFILAEERLGAAMLQHKPFLKADVSVEDLADLSGLTQGELSQLLNEHMGTRFYEYVNKFRVQEFVQLLDDEFSRKLTLTALAEQCGFSSKSTFYRAFKHEKGMTPAQFVKMKSDS